MTELKPCPFCGAAASAWEWNGGARVDCSKWRADAYSVYTHYVGIGARTMEEAIELWNRRAEQPSAQRWIPWDSGKLPKESGYYTVTAYDGATKRVTYAKYQKRLKRWELTGARAYWRVLAWLPPLEPWRGGAG